MTFRQLLIALFFLPQITLAQQPGIVYDTIPCKNSPGQTYALYLPSDYSSSRSSGLILFYEPAARGKLPVGLYQKIADKYSIILACSNNSRNGSIDVSLRAGNAVLEDVLARFNVDRKFILSSGFSGGARTAVDMAGRDRNITGVIACGAAFSKPDAIKMEKPIPFAEVIGELDMNYQEALRASEYLKMIHNPALLTFFYAGHQWPPTEAYEEAVAWHQLRTYKNSDLEKEIITQTLKRAKVQIDSGYLFEASRILRQMPGVKPVDSLFSIVGKDRRTKSQQKDAERANLTEQRLQKEFFYAYSRHLAYAAPDSAYHPAYWTGFRRECDKMVTGDRYRKMAGLRLIDYGWRLCAEQHFIFMNEEAYRQAAMCARIWSLMQPANPNPCLQAARAFALQKRKTETLDYLQQAASRGFKDQKVVATDLAFKGLLSDNEIAAVFH